MKERNLLLEWQTLEKARLESGGFQSRVLDHEQSMATTRPICPECKKSIEASGGKLTSPTTAVFP